LYFYISIGNFMCNCLSRFKRWAIYKICHPTCVICCVTMRHFAESLFAFVYSRSSCWPQKNCHQLTCVQTRMLIAAYTGIQGVSTVWREGGQLDRAPGAVGAERDGEWGLKGGLPPPQTTSESGGSVVSSPAEPRPQMLATPSAVSLVWKLQRKPTNFRQSIDYQIGCLL